MEPDDKFYERKRARDAVLKSTFQDGEETSIEPVMVVIPRNRRDPEPHRADR